MARPIIAVTGDFDPENGRYYLKREYMEAIWTVGGIPVIIEPKVDKPMEWSGDREEYMERIEIEDDLLEAVDGILFTGGNDIDPAYTGDPVQKWCGELQPWRDSWEVKLARIARERNIPSLGLCRGIQTLAASMGVKLAQDLYQEEGTTCQHSQKAPTWYPTHTVTTEEGSKLREILGETLWVNSFHHQCIKSGLEKYPFAITARAMDGIIEGFEIPEKKFFVGVQWHPERMMHDPIQRALFKAFVDAAAEK